MMERGEASSKIESNVAALRHEVLHELLDQPPFRSSGAYLHLDTGRKQYSDGDPTVDSCHYYKTDEGKLITKQP